jgi:hypothetical protein
MAQLTAKEFEDMISLLANHLHLDRFHEKLLKANALVSRKRPPSAQVLAGQLYQLSAGLRRNHPARYAVELLWQEMLGEKIKEEHGKMLEGLADRINECLTDKLEIIPTKSADLLTALGSYHQAVATLTNDEVAYLEVLMRGSTDVAQFLRNHQADILAASTATSPTSEASPASESTPVESSRETTTPSSES